MTGGSFEGAGPEARYKAFLASGKFMIQRSRSTGRFVFYPRTIAPGSGETDLEWVEASGDGVVYATTCTRRPADKGGDYNVSLIDLAEGPRMMARVVGIPANEVRIGMKVKAKIATLQGQPTVIFERA